MEVLLYVCTPIQRHRGMEQLVARWAHNPKVAGSSPAPATQKATLTSGFFFALWAVLAGQKQKSWGSQIIFSRPEPVPFALDIAQEAPYASFTENMVLISN